MVKTRVDTNTNIFCRRKCKLFENKVSLCQMKIEKKYIILRNTFLNIRVVLSIYIFRF
jgi:hypothetical protein